MSAKLVVGNFAVSACSFSLSVHSFTARFEVMRATHPSTYYVCVIEHGARIVATASLVLEWKFIHSAGFRGRIEDVVVDECERGKRLGNV